jgi:hypothetical protein
MDTQPSVNQSVMRAMQRRQQGTPQAALSQVSPQAASSQGLQVPAPVTTDAAGIQGPPAQGAVPTMKEETNENIIVKSLTDYLKNSQKLQMPKF